MVGTDGEVGIACVSLLVDDSDTASGTVLVMTEGCSLTGASDVLRLQEEFRSLLVRVGEG